MTSVKKDIKKLLKKMSKNGWRIEKGKHIKAYSPCGKYILVVAGSSSDSNAINQIKRQLKHMGY